jgi:hypothetical protein
MNVEDHRRAIRESLEVIKEAVQRGLEQRQRTIGFHCSAAATDLLELFLHQHNAINPGKVIKHDFFASEKKAHRRLPEDFSDKKIIISLLVQLETKRNLLCYGKIKPQDQVEEYLTLFRKVRAFFDAKQVKYDEE